MPTDSRGFLFGPGKCFSIVQTYTDGTTPVAPVTPRQFDVQQDFSVDFTLSAKELTGELTYPVAVGIGEGKVSGKIANARFQAGVYNDIVFGRNPTTGLSTGRILMAEPGEPHTVPASTPWTVTVTNGTNFLQDYGVYYGDSGLQMRPVVTVSSAGTYSVTAGTGTYTFNTADANRPIIIYYSWTETPAIGQTVTVWSEIQGAVGIADLRYQGMYGGRRVGVYLPNIVVNKAGIATKQKDFIIANIEYSAFATPQGVVAYLYTQE